MRKYQLLFIAAMHRKSLSGVVIPFEGLLTFLIIFGVMISNTQRAILITRFTAIVLTISAIWLLGSNFIEEPFTSIRQYLYAAQVVRYAAGHIYMQDKTGLTFNHFAMGYQLSAGFMLVVFLVFIEKRRWRLFWLFSSIIMIVGITLAAQRSAIAAIGSAFVIFFLYKKRIKYLMAVIAVAVLILFSSNYLESRNYGIETISQKFVMRTDTMARLGWQLAALKIIAERPAGNIFENLNWEQESVKKGADYAAYGWNIKYVHNAYLGSMLSLG